MTPAKEAELFKARSAISQQLEQIQNTLDLHTKTLDEHTKILGLHTHS